METLHPYGEENVAFGWQRVSSSGAALIGIMRQSTLDGYMEKFDEAGVAVLAGTAFGAVGKNNLRLSYANSRENLAEAVERIRAFVLSL